MLKMIILVGLPGCGKSTWAKNYLKNNNGYVRVNRDDLRMMFFNELFVLNTPERENLVTQISNEIIERTLKSGKNIIIDNTNLSSKYRNNFHDIAQKIGNVEVEEIVFEIPIETILNWNAEREGQARVPDKVIKNMIEKYHIQKNGKFKNYIPKTKYYKPNIFNKYKQNINLPSAIICDLDGTLCILNGRNPYNASTCENDELNKPIAFIIEQAYKANKKIIFLSGREDRYLSQTLKFFEKNIPQIENYELHMRKTGDIRKDSIIKKELFEQHIKNKYYIDFVVDDRPQVIRMWRYDLGLTVFGLNDQEF